MNEFQYRRMLRALGQRQHAALRAVQEHREREVRRQGRAQGAVVRRIDPQPPHDLAA